MPEYRVKHVEHLTEKERQSLFTLIETDEFNWRPPDDEYFGTGTKMREHLVLLKNGLAIGHIEIGLPLLSDIDLKTEALNQDKREFEKLFHGKKQAGPSKIRPNINLRLIRPELDSLKITADKRVRAEFERLHKHSIGAELFAHLIQITEAHAGTKFNHVLFRGSNEDEEEIEENLRRSKLVFDFEKKPVLNKMEPPIRLITLSKKIRPKIKISQ